VHPFTRFSSERLENAGFVRPVTFADALARYADVLSERAVRTDEVLP
jgi:hypothetical protein